MDKIKEDYVSFEVAKVLKEKGFEGDVNGYELAARKPTSLDV